MTFYYIVSQMHGLVLDLENGGNKPVPRVVPWNRTGAESQLWYDDPSTGTIRNRLNYYCIDVEADVAIVKPYNEGDSNQQWERYEKNIRMRKHHNKVLDIFRGNTEPGAEVGPYKHNGALNQSWEFEFIESSWGASEPNDPTQSSRRFFIVSEMNHLVVDIAGCHAAEGTKIIMYPKNDDIQRNQLWYLDRQGYIRSDLNDMVFASDEQGGKLKMREFSPSDPRSQWIVDRNRIVNRTGEVLDIRGGHESKGTDLCAFESRGTPNQQWHIQYV